MSDIPVKTIVAGSRSITDHRIVFAAIRAFQARGYEISELVSGMCRGPDMIAYRAARRKGLAVREFPADWSKHGKAAGPIRNRQMAEYADALVAVYDGKSRGTRNMIDEAVKRNLRVHVFHGWSCERGEDD
jgi:hypothetical protein